MGSRTETLFLDGVHELDATTQRALLSLLPDGEPKGNPGKPAATIYFLNIAQSGKGNRGWALSPRTVFPNQRRDFAIAPLRERKEDIRRYWNISFPELPMIEKINRGAGFPGLPFGSPSGNNESNARCVVASSSCTPSKNKVLGAASPFPPLKEAPHATLQQSTGVQGGTIHLIERRFTQSR